jgi:hypothetical protein
VKRTATLGALLILALTVFTSAQTTQPSSGARTKKVTVSGKISADGKAIVAGGRAWVVSNVEKLREHVGEDVTVKGLLDPITSRIEVLSMKLSRNEVSASARLGDSAFRR